MAVSTLTKYIRGDVLESGAGIIIVKEFDGYVRCYATKYAKDIYHFPDGRIEFYYPANAVSTLSDRYTQPNTQPKSAFNTKETGHNFWEAPKFTAKQINDAFDNAYSYKSESINGGHVMDINTSSCKLCGMPEYWMAERQVYQCYKAMECFDV